MNLQHQDLARAEVNARLASAHERRLAHQVMRSRRAARRADRERLLRRWLDRLLHGKTVNPSVASSGRIRPLRLASARGHHAQPMDELAGLLDRVAQQIVEHGTQTEARVLEGLSAATRQVSPGAAAALVDWRGSEIARLRAYGIVHGVVLDSLGPYQQSVLLARLRGGTDLPLAG